MQISELCLRSYCVDLAHISAAVLLPHVGYVKEPCPVLVVRDADARVPRDDVVVYREDRWLLKVHPRHLYGF